MDYILNSKKKSFNFKFEIVQTALSDDIIIQLKIKSKDRNQRKFPAILGRLLKGLPFWVSQSIHTLFL